MSIKLQDAKDIIEAMLKYASVTKVGRAMAFAIVDSAGALVCFSRMDGASALNSRMAINKAYTAIDWKRDTKEIREKLFTGEGKRDVAWFGEPRLAPIPGGVLLNIGDGTIVGAIGTSGRIADEPGGDEELAQVGKRAFQEILKRKGEL